MANFAELLVEKLEEFQASLKFDKEALLEAHDKYLKATQQMESLSMEGHYKMEFTVRNPSSENWRPSAALKALQPIRVRELQLDKHHNDNVLFGTLCAVPLRMVGIMTILEDRFGDAVRLAIYNTSTNQSPSSLYPKGSKVAVKQPYFKQGAQDGVFMLRVDNPQDVEILASFPTKEEKITSLAKSLFELRNKGNMYFRDEDWSKAIEFYSACIDLALSGDEIKSQLPSDSNIQEKVKENLLYSYSNRAEARIKLKQYENAVHDSDKALALDQEHLKSLFRKGRAFHHLREYELACQCFDRALEQSPTNKDIKLHYEKSVNLSHQNKHGKFDLSSYFINGCCNASEYGNYVGPVLIKKSLGRGRGLFCSENVNIGDFLLVDNAIAFSSTETTRILKGSAERVRLSKQEVKKKHDLLKWDLEEKVIGSAALSPRIRQQLEFLTESDESKVPPMDLFRINNSSWNNYQICNQDPELEEHRFPKVMLNVACHMQPIESKSDLIRQNEQYGLWVLPSFINHSCYPNANPIVVGEAMFIIAARKIELGEEITIPYFLSLVPLLKRESVCTEMRFKCECKRCMLERSLLAAEASPLQEIAEFICSREANMRILSDLELCKIAVRVENVIEGLTTEEKQMMRTSFFPLYYNIFMLQRIHPNFRATLPSLREVCDGFHEVVPGNPLCFKFFARFPVYVKNEAETEKLLFNKALEVCSTYMGKQEEGLLKAVVKSVATDVFKPGVTLFGVSDINNEALIFSQMVCEVLSQ